MKTITGHFEWNAGASAWAPLDHKRPADNLVLEQLAPDRQGISGWLSMADLLPLLPEAYRSRVCGNGTNMFNRGRGLGKDFVFEKGPAGRIVAVRSIGLVPQIQRAQSIRDDIAQAIRLKPCVVLVTHQNVQPDHKVGRKNDRRLEDTAAQVAEDFQPLNITVNVVKRTHCRRCQESHSRFDARLLGFSHGWWVGDEKSDTCNGCYWHDPARFNAELSRDFKP